jgi:hypothetical protein
MSNSDPQQYWYSVVPENGNGLPFGYIYSQGTLYVGSAGLEFYNGQWFDPSGIEVEQSVDSFGNGGTMFKVSITTPTAVSETWTTAMAFNTALDFTQPLPLDQLSMADSYWEASTQFGQSFKSPLSSITPMPGPPSDPGNA